MLAFGYEHALASLMQHHNLEDEEVSAYVADVRLLVLPLIVTMVLLLVFALS